MENTYIPDSGFVLPSNRGIVDGRVRLEVMNELESDVCVNKSHPLEPEGIRKFHHTYFPVLAPDSPAYVLAAIKQEIDLHGEAVIFVHTDLVNTDSDHYQRAGKKSKVQRISRNWRWGSFDKLNLTLREGGLIFDKDGQHRMESGLLRFGNPTILPAILRKSEGVAAEAESWEDINHDNASAREKFKSRVSRGDDKAAEINRICRSHGATIIYHSNKPKHGEIKSVATLERIYEFWGKAPALNTVLRFAKRAFGFHPKSLQENWLWGIMKFIYSYGTHPNFDWETAVSRVGDRGVEGISDFSEKIKHSASRSMPASDRLATAMAQAYNFRQNKSKQIIPVR